MKMIEGKINVLTQENLSRTTSKESEGFDIGIITIIMFGQFVVRSPQMYMASLSPTIYTTISETATNTASEGAAYSSELTGYSLSLSDYLSLDTSF